MSNLPQLDSDVFIYEGLKAYADFITELEFVLTEERIAKLLRFCVNRYGTYRGVFVNAATLRLRKLGFNELAEKLRLAEGL